MSTKSYRDLFLSLASQISEKHQASLGQVPKPDVAELTNSICHQAYRPQLTNVQLREVQAAIEYLSKSRTSLMSAMAVMEGYKHISKRELLLAASFCDGYIYMLEQHLIQNKSGLNEANFTRGVLS